MIGWCPAGRLDAVHEGLVLSGGAGTRSCPITHTSAKQLVPVANKPVLLYGLEAIRDAGETEVGIIVGDTQAEIEAVVGDGAGRYNHFQQGTIVWHPAPGARRPRRPRPDPGPVGSHWDARTGQTTVS